MKPAMTGKPLGMAKKAMGMAKKPVGTGKAFAPGQLKKAAGAVKGAAKNFAKGFQRKGVM